MGRKIWSMLLLTMVLSAVLTEGMGCSSQEAKGKRSSGCKECVVNQMKKGCPACVAPLRCLAKCLWSGSSRSKCVGKCDCYGGKPKLSDCKKCMSKCRCSCVA